MIKRLNLFIIIILVFFSAFACSPQKKKNIEISFYHWKSKVLFDKTEWSYLQDLAVKKIYLRYFDVDWNEYEQRAQPVGDVDFDKSYLKDFQIIPTIFITNRTMVNLPDNQVVDLAKNLLKRIVYSNLPIKEIQLDCDWTASTQFKFFALIKAMQVQLKDKNIEISVTIRLHQFKNFKQTGVPPIHKGVLMFYNMGDLKGGDEANSILDLEIAQSYLNGKNTYPLKLDIALPIFAWGVLQRQGKIIDLMSSLDEGQLLNKNYFKKTGKNTFQAIKSHYVEGKYLYKDDLIRIEKVSEKQLFQSVRLLKPHFKQDTLNVLFYHLDSHTLRYFKPKTLETLAKEFE